MTTATCDLPLSERLKIGQRLTRPLFGKPEPAILATMLALLMEHPDADEAMLSRCLSVAYGEAKVLSRPPCPHATALILQRVALEAAQQIAFVKGIESGRIRAEAEPEEAPAPAAGAVAQVGHAIAEVAEAVGQVAGAIADALDGEDPVAEVERGEPPKAADKAKAPAVSSSKEKPAGGRKPKQRLYPERRD